MLIKGERLTIRRASLADADFMEKVELDEDNSPWVDIGREAGELRNSATDTCSRPSLKRTTEHPSA